MKKPKDNPIKPCPFCGYKALFERNSCDSWAIVCQKRKCRARMIGNVPRKWPGKCWVIGDFKESDRRLGLWVLMNDLSPRWNNRKTMSGSKR